LKLADGTEKEYLVSADGNLSGPLTNGGIFGLDKDGSLFVQVDYAADVKIAVVTRYTDATVDTVTFDVAGNTVTYEVTTGGPQPSDFGSLGTFDVDEVTNKVNSWTAFTPTSLSYDIVSVDAGAGIITLLGSDGKYYVVEDPVVYKLDNSLPTNLPVYVPLADVELWESVGCVEDSLGTKVQLDSVSGSPLVRYTYNIPNPLTLGAINKDFNNGNPWVWDMATQGVQDDMGKTWAEGGELHVHEIFRLTYSYTENDIVGFFGGTARGWELADATGTVLARQYNRNPDGGDSNMLENPVPEYWCNNNSGGALEWSFRDERAAFADPNDPATSGGYIYEDGDDVGLNDRVEIWGADTTIVPVGSYTIIVTLTHDGLDFVRTLQFEITEEDVRHADHDLAND